MLKNSRIVVSAVVGFILLGILLHTQGATQSTVESLGRLTRYQTTSVTAPKPFDKSKFAGLRVAVDESTVFHNEVLAASLFQVNDLGVNTTVYRYDWGEGNEEVVRQFYDGPDPIFQGDQGEDVLSDAVARGEYDVVYLVTCEGTLWVRPRIMEEITNNPDVQLICLMHFVWQIEDYKKHYKAVAATGRMTIYVLSEAVRRLTILKLSEWAQHDKYSGWDNVKVELFVPIFTLPEEVTHKAESKAIGYNEVAIQGGVTQSRRDYKGTFADLIAAIKEDPDLWGYTIPEGEDQPFRPKVHAENEQTPFQLHLVGNMADEIVELPKELAKVVKHHVDLPQADYYDVLGQMDLILPVFVQDGYYVNTASSTMPTGLITRTPILSNLRHLEGYTYLSPVGAVVHPTSMRPVEAIKLLRQGRDPWTKEMKRPVPFSKTGYLHEDGSYAVQNSPMADNMGKHSDALWSEYFERVRTGNRDIMVDMLESHPTKSLGFQKEERRLDGS